jgi:hypothetical protein
MAGGGGAIRIRRALAAWRACLVPTAWWSTLKICNVMRAQRSCVRRRLLRLYGQSASPRCVNYCVSRALIAFLCIARAWPRHERPCCFCLRNRGGAPRWKNIAHGLRQLPAQSCYPRRQMGHPVTPHVFGIALSGSTNGFSTTMACRSPIFGISTLSVVPNTD